MTVEDIKQYCMSKNAAYETQPFGDVPICYKLNNKIFAQLYPYEHDYKITLKCTADVGDFYRMIYPGKVVRGYHCPPVQQPYFNTFALDCSVPDEIIFEMIDHSYSVVIGKLPKYLQRKLNEEQNNAPTIYIHCGCVFFLLIHLMGMLGVL